MLEFFERIMFYQNVLQAHNVSLEQILVLFVICSAIALLVLSGILHTIFNSLFK